MSYLLCFAVFFLYAWAVLSYTVFPIRLDLDSAYVQDMRASRGWDGFVNLIPLAIPTGTESIQMYGNVLLGIPFGFGWSFIVGRPSLRRTMRDGLIVFAGIELIQLVVGLAYGFPYRVIDVNDVLLNLLGVALGAGALLLFSRVYLRLVGPEGASGVGWDHVDAVLTRI